MNPSAKLHPVLQNISSFFHAIFDLVRFFVLMIATLGILLTSLTYDVFMEETSLVMRCLG